MLRGEPPSCTCSTVSETSAPGTAEDRVRQLLAAPFAAILSPELRVLQVGRAVLVLPYREDSANRNGTLHGGALATLAGLAAASALASDVKHPPAQLPAPLVDHAIHYVATATREAVTAEARLVRRGRELAFLQVSIDGAEGHAVLRSMVAYRIGAARQPSAWAGEAFPVVDDSVLSTTRAPGSPFTRRLGITMRQLEAGRSVAILPHREEHFDCDGRVHDGALAALVDCAGGASAWSAGGGFDPRGRAATITMGLCFDGARGPQGIGHSPSAKEDVLAIARTPYLGGELSTGHVALVGRMTGQRIGAASITFRIVRPANPS